MAITSKVRVAARLSTIGTAITATPASSAETLMVTRLAFKDSVKICLSTSHLEM
ncbi:hypothetical protein D3C87_2170090 [compost metagenome]